MSRNVLFVSSYYGPYYSNYIASIIALEKYLKKNDIISFYIFPKDAENFSWVPVIRQEIDNVTFLDYRPKSKDNLQFIRDYIRQKHIDMVYSRFGGWDRTAQLTNCGVPIIWHMDMYVNVEHPLKRIKNFLKYRFIASKKIYHVAVSYPVGENINSFKPKNRCVVIPNAVDTERLTLFAETKDDSKFKCLLFGYDPYVKGLDIVLDSFERIIPLHNNFQLIVSAQEKTYRYIDQRYSSIPSWLKLIPPTDNVSELYNNVDLMISASRSESFSYCIAEALYLGLPILMSNINGTNWAMEFENVDIFDINNPIQIDKKIIEISKKYISDEVKKHNKDLIENKYSIDAWCKKEIEYIEEIIG